MGLVPHGRSAVLAVLLSLAVGSGTAANAAACRECTAGQACWVYPRCGCRPPRGLWHLAGDHPKAGPRGVPRLWRVHGAPVHRPGVRAGTLAGPGAASLGLPAWTVAGAAVGRPGTPAGGGRRCVQHVHALFEHRHWLSPRPRPRPRTRGPGAQVFGGKVVRAPSGVMHGKTSPVFHNDTGLLAGLGNPFKAARYHSLVIEKDSCPEELEVTAW